MNPLQGNIDDFGMDTISLAGPLEAIEAGEARLLGGLR